MLEQISNGQARSGGRRGRTMKTNILEEKNKEMENNRLLKRLSEINNRKNKFLSEIGREYELPNSNVKCRQAYRLQKNKEIQH